MKIVLTGASGLLGAHLLQEGLSRGHEIIALGRSIPPKSYLSKLIEQKTPKLSFQHFDLAAEFIGPELESVLKDVDTCIHAAAFVSAESENSEVFSNINLLGGQRLFLQMQQLQIPHFVQISSISTMCSGGDEIVDENFQGEFRPTAYAQSKYQFDEWLEVHHGNTQLLTFHPCYMLGPWDSKPSSGAIMLAMKMKRFTYYFDKIKNFVAPEDVARGIIDGVEQKLTGRYILGGENVELSDFIPWCAEKLDVDPSHFIAIQPWEVEGLKSSGKLSTLNEKFLQEFCLSSAVDTTKAHKTFGFCPEIPWKQMVERTLDYFVTMRLLRPKKVL